LELVSSPAVAAPKQPTIAELIAQLGSAKYAERETAATALQRIGEDALPELEKARGNTDPEIGRRATDLIKKIERANLRQIRAAGKVWTLAFSPDGQYLASGCFGALDGLPGKGKSSYDVQIWEVASAKLAGTFAGNTNQVSTVRFSPDGKLLAAACYDGETRIWEVAAREQSSIVGGERRFARPGEPAVSGLAFSPDGKWMATGGSDGMIRVAKLGGAKRSFKAHEKWVLDLAYAMDGKFIVSAGSYDTVLRVWEAETGKSVFAFEGHPASLRRVAVSPDGKYVVGATGGCDSKSGGSLHLWDLTTGKEIRKFVGHDKWAEDVAFTKDGKRLLSAGHESDRTVRLWDVATGKELKRYEYGVESSPCIAVSPDGVWAASGGFDGIITLFKLPK
jgi:WD40 repeat protein